ncbi:unnamed protein product [Mesocestoides corti]|uniref:peptidylprolyl isomerase n=1 Tax=Mesocestoides corti TaxID=53468 RepID=A0A0R3UFZ5_MESCO|nr:unnamed protein product [Mesocestoides corti]
MTESDPTTGSFPTETDGSSRGDDDTVGPLPSEMTAGGGEDIVSSTPGSAAGDLKRGRRRNSTDLDVDDDGDTVGPLPSEMEAPSSMEPPKKKPKKRVLKDESILLRSIPTAQYYEISYMHRNVITHLAYSKTHYLITCSCDGHLKFWHLAATRGLEFVKHYRAHLGVINGLALSYDGELACTVGDDKTAKIFDIINFDMISMMKLGFVPRECCFVYTAKDGYAAIAITDRDSSAIHIFDARTKDTLLRTLDKLHSSPVIAIAFSPALETVVSADTEGMLEFWSTPRHDYASTHPPALKWTSKMDTDLYCLLGAKTHAVSLAFSPNDGHLLACFGADRKIRIFKTLTGKLSLVYDESLQHYSELQSTKQLLPSMEFGRRLALEKELDRSDGTHMCNLEFDRSGNFLIYTTMLGIRVVNLVTNRLVRSLGGPENLRLLQVALLPPRSAILQSSTSMALLGMDSATASLEMHAIEGTADSSVGGAGNSSTVPNRDPVIVCTAFKKNRVYLFTNREPHEIKSDGDSLSAGSTSERDVFNEKPTKEEVLAASRDSAASATASLRLAGSAILHTTLGDIHLRLWPRECPRTVENFVGHSRAGYYNGHIFHRVIKGFMIQTGCPLGTGTGGKSIWGGEFEDEFHPSLRHDRPYTPWLDNKHTVFGRVIKGMEVVQKISNVKTNPKTDKPLDDISIISISVKDLGSSN